MSLDHSLLPLSLYHKAKSLIWDPREIDLSRDTQDWQRLSDRERNIILRLSSQFLGGEEAVTHDLAPLLTAIRHDGNLLEEEMFLTAQLFEESKHVEWFDRWFSSVSPLPAREGLGVRANSVSYNTLFNIELPTSLHRLLTNTSPEAQVDAFVTYHVIIEGVLAETGYRGYVRALKDNGIMPGTVRGVELVQRDEARHIAYGLYALQRLFKAQPALRDVAQARLNTLLPLVFEIVGDTFAPYGDDIPFGLDPSEFVAYASEQFDSRMTVLERVNAG